MEARRQRWHNKSRNSLFSTLFYSYLRVEVREEIHLCTANSRTFFFLYRYGLGRYEASKGKTLTLPPLTRWDFPLVILTRFDTRGNSRKYIESLYVSFVNVFQGTWSNTWTLLTMTLTRLPFTDAEVMIREKKVSISCGDLKALVLTDLGRIRDENREGIKDETIISLLPFGSYDRRGKQWKKMESCHGERRVTLSSYPFQLRFRHTRRLQEDKTMKLLKRSLTTVLIYLFMSYITMPRDE